ncbi:hypothetical protein DFH09DRAFT_1306165 [Mycena vulgaris]|nr:hypothetical protein DFH09DRAFT_1306165 [Mycena vulgaris]
MHLLFYILLGQIARTAATLSNRTIDDTKGDIVSGLLPVYSPAASFSLNSNCSKCSVKLDPSQVFDGTWHDSSQLPGGKPVSITLSFHGTAIYVFCILANAVKNAVTNSDFLFSLDGLPRGRFTHEPSSSPDYTYGANVFSAHGLELGPHELVLATDNSTGSLLLFDYAIYTFEDKIEVTQTTATATVTSTVLATSTAKSQSSSTASISVSLPSSAGPSPITSSTPASAASRTPTPALARILPATLIPILLVALIGAGLYRRHAHYKREVEKTRAHPPEPAWVCFADPDAAPPRTKAAGDPRTPPPDYRSGASQA